MKKLAWVAAASVALAVLAAGAAEQPDRPSGVEEGDWVQISERFGFVVAPERGFPIPTGDVSGQILIAPPDAVSHVLMPPLKGYFVAKTSMGWRRVTVAADGPEWLPLKGSQSGR